MQYYLWKVKVNGEIYSIFTIAPNEEVARRISIRNAPKACRKEIEDIVETKPRVIKGPYSFLVKAEVDFDCKNEDSD